MASPEAVVGTGCISGSFFELFLSIFEQDAGRIPDLLFSWENGN